MSEAFIANELKARLLEHAPNLILPAKKLELSTADIQKKYQNTEFDCVIAPLVLISQEEYSVFFKEINRILAPSGIFLFSTLGDDAPHELEMLGDALLKTGFYLPVVDKEKLQLYYEDMNFLLNDLEQSNVQEKFVRITKSSDGDIVATFNVMYGCAFGSIVEIAPSGKIEIPLESIKIRKPR